MKLFLALFLPLVCAASAAAQETKMSITMQPPASITVDGEIVFPVTSESYQFEAGEGGTFDFINSDGSSVKVVFFVGTTQVTLDFFIDSYEQSAVTATRPLPTGRNVVGSLIYDMRTFEGAGATLTFDNPFAMTVGYSDAHIAGLDEETLNIYFWNEDQDTWETFASSTVNTADNLITIFTDHLTLFATLGEVKEEEPTPTTATISVEGWGGGGGGPISQVFKKESPVALEPKVEELKEEEEGEEEPETEEIPIPEEGEASVKNDVTANAKVTRWPASRISPVRPEEAREEAQEEAEKEIPQALLDVGFQLDTAIPSQERSVVPMMTGAVGILAIIIVAGVFVLARRKS